MSKFARILQKVVLFAAIFFVVGVASQESANAASRYRNSDVFMKRYCVYVSAKLLGLDGILAAINNIIARVEALANIVDNLRIGLKPPSLDCLATLDPGGVGVVGGGNLADLAKCFEGLIPKIVLPNIDNLAQCLKDLIPNLQLRFPSFDPTQCLPQLSLPDLGAIVEQLVGILRALQEILAGLKNLKPRLQAGLNAEMMAHLRFLASLCRSAGIRAKK